MRAARRVLAAIASVVLVGALAAPAAPAPDPIKRGDWSSALLALSDMAAHGAFSGGAGQIDNLTCESTGDPDATIDLSCDDQTSPENETPIAVDPEDPDHLLAGSNDYFVQFKGGTIVARVPTGFFVSFDGGATWTDGQIPMGPGGNGGNGDPVPAFNAKFDTAHMAQLSAGCGLSYCGNISVSVSSSADGGLTWSRPVTVALGSGSFTPSARGIFNDKPWMTVDNDPASDYFGRIYVTYSRFRLSRLGYVESPIYMSYSDDAGASWTAPREISGSNQTYCTYQEFGPAGECDEDQFSAPVVLPGGDVVVHFLNGQNAAAWESAQEFESQTMAVRSTDGGTTWSAPVHIADLEDGYGDYPQNVDGRLTQTGHQFRTQSVQGLAVDPENGDLYAFWTDNRDGVHDPAAGEPVTKTNVFMTKSTDGGESWTGPDRVTSGKGDRWFAWGAAYDGTVGVMYMDGAYDWPNRDKYGITLATSTDGGASWSFERVHSALSDPDHSVWFRANVAGCEQCARFIGDYNGLAIDSLGRAHVVWTDMSRVATVPRLGRTGAPQDVFYARR